MIRDVFFYDYFLAFLTFYEQYQRAPALVTQDVDIPNLMKIIGEKTSASASNSIQNEEFNDELLK
jgi:hypothetical protein